MERVTWSVDAGVADVRLARPEKLNAVDAAMLDALVDVAGRVADDAAVRVVVLSGEGRGFCSGLDLSLFDVVAAGGAAAGAGPKGRPLGERAQRAVRVWSELAVPVIAAVHGPALGAGLELALAADLRVVAPDAQLGAIEIRWGMVPDMTATQLLPRLVGMDVAKELVLTGRTVTGEEAVRLGLATRAAEHPRDAAMALAGEIAGKNPAAVRAAKHLLDLAGTAPLAVGLRAERETMESLVGTPNQVEAMRAYRESRPARFED